MFVRTLGALTVSLSLGLGLAATVHAAPPPQPSSNWSERMPAEAAASYLRESDKRVLVVAGGEASAVLKDVETTMLDALRASGRLDLVMDASGLGAVGSASDQDIITKAKALPLDAIMIVRVFGDGAQASVVGTSYALDGTVISAFSIAPGASLSARTDAGDGSGLSESAVGTITDVMEENENEDGAEGSFTAAEQEYLERFLHYRYLVSFNVYTGQGTAMKTSQVLRGIDNIPLSDFEVLNHIGEPNLAKRHRNRNRLKSSLLISGAVLGFGPLIPGVALLVLTNVEDCNDELAATITCDNPAPYYNAGVGLTVVGSLFTAGFIVGAALPKIVKTEEKLELVKRFNRELRGELSLPEDIEDRLLSSTERVDRDNRRARMLATWQLAPTGTGLSFSGRF